MNYRQELYKISDKLLSIKNFDLESFIFNYRRMVNSIYHFHNVIGKNARNNQDLSRIKYNIKDMPVPKEGQVAYFYIENSYPKEIFNSHWCLILKHFGNTMLVIPMTSIKSSSASVDKEIEMIVKIKDFENDGCCKLKVHQMFCADTMRINTNKKIYELQTDFSYVKEKVYKMINLY